MLSFAAVVEMMSNSRGLLGVLCRDYLTVLRFPIPFAMWLTMRRSMPGSHYFLPITPRLWFIHRMHQKYSHDRQSRTCSAALGYKYSCWIISIIVQALSSTFQFRLAVCTHTASFHKMPTLLGSAIFVFCSTIPLSLIASARQKRALMRQ